MWGHALSVCWSTHARVSGCVLFRSNFSKSSPVLLCISATDDMCLLGRWIWLIHSSGNSLWQGQLFEILEHVVNIIWWDNASFIKRIHWTVCSVVTDCGVSFNVTCSRMFACSAVEMRRTLTVVLRHVWRKFLYLFVYDEHMDEIHYCGFSCYLLLACIPKTEAMEYNRQLALECLFIHLFYLLKQ